MTTAGRLSAGFLTAAALSLTMAATRAVPVAAQQDMGIALDGRVDPAEWKSASSRDMEGGGKVHLMVRDTLLYVGIQGPAPGTAHVCVHAGDQVRLLHVSAAVGSATYRPADGGWRLQSPFEWSLRDSGGRAAGDARAAYLQKEGWVGTVSGMGPDRELVIDRSKFGSNRVRLAVAYITTPGGNPSGQVARWPDTRDACTEQKTVAGFAPETARFLVNDWAVVE
jgi:hypothetical protein